MTTPAGSPMPADVNVRLAPDGIRRGIGTTAGYRPLARPRRPYEGDRDGSSPELRSVGQRFAGGIRRERSAGDLPMAPSPHVIRRDPRARCRNARPTSDVGAATSNHSRHLRRSPTMSIQANPDTVAKKTSQAPRKVVAGHFLPLDGVAEAADPFITARDDETDARAMNSSPPRTWSFSAAVRTTSGLSSGQAARSSLSPPSSTPFPSTSRRRRPLEREWTNSHVIDGELVDFVRHLKGRPGGDIGVQAASRSSRRRSS
jgi:hypothetical protein